MQRAFHLDSVFDLRSTVRIVKAGVIDRSGTWWWSIHTRRGTATVGVERFGDRLVAQAWGDGREMVLERVPAVLGLSDRIGIDPEMPSVSDLVHRTAGTRLGATGEVFEATARAILGQVVTTSEAKRSTRLLIDRYGVTAPGPNETLRIFPLAETIATLTYDDLHDLGIERKRASTMIEAARRARRLQEIVDMAPDAARRRLLAVRGIGSWTAEFVMGVAYGDKDAVTPGDYHLPNTVSFALAGEPRGDDARMFELLEPYRPERRRVVVALKVEGVHAPRYGPKTPVRRHL